MTNSDYLNWFVVVTLGVIATAGVIGWAACEWNRIPVSSGYGACVGMAVGALANAVKHTLARNAGKPPRPE